MPAKGENQTLLKENPAYSARFMQAWNRIDPSLKLVVGLFLTSRVILTLLGSMAHIFIIHDFSFHSWLQVWGVWDTADYLAIARNGYSVPLPFDPHTYNTIGFFPFYPLLISWLRLFFAGDYFLTGLVLSNLFFLASCYYLYKLILLDFDLATTQRTLKYYILFPTAFILSAVYPESLFWLLVIMCLYYARLQRWWLVAGCGFILTYTKATGILVLVPLFLLLMQQKKYQLKPILLSLPFLLVIPGGWLLFARTCYLKTGDYLAYIHIQQGAWGHFTANPLSILGRSALSSSPDLVFDAWFGIVLLVLVLLQYKKLFFTYWFFALIIIVAAPANGEVYGLIRYVCGLFPIALLLAQGTQKPGTDQLATTSLALFQGGLFIFWTLSFWFTS